MNCLHDSIPSCLGVFFLIRLKENLNKLYNFLANARVYSCLKGNHANVYVNCLFM